jgi:hypothetical protein
MLQIVNAWKKRREKIMPGIRMIFNGRNWREESHERIMFNFIFNAHTQDVRDGAQQQSADGRVDAGREERVQLEKERSRRSAFMLFSISQ